MIEQNGPLRKKGVTGLSELIPKKPYRYVHRRRYAANALRRLIDDPKTGRHDRGEYIKWYILLEGLLPPEALAKIAEPSKASSPNYLTSFTQPDGTPDLIGGQVKAL